jgi:hypothetical protein
MTTHAKLSPSKRAQWSRCPGSVREQARYPDFSGPSAIDGTHSHRLLEICLKGGNNAAEFLGKELESHEGKFIVDRDRAARVQIALDYVDKRVNDATGGCRVLAESKVDPEHLIGRDDMSGTTDIRLYYDDIMEVCDYKDGFGDVDVVNNEQLEQYALGALAELKLPINAVYPFKWVRMTIIQPKLALKGLPVITSHILSVADILGMIGRMVVEAKATDDPEAPLIAGDKQCKFCRVPACTAKAAKVMEDIGVMFQPTNQFVIPIAVAPDTQILEIAHQAAGKDPAVMDNSQLRQILEAAPLMRQLLDDVDTEVLKRFKAGVSIPGLKAVNGRGSRNWNLPEDQIADKLIKMGIPKGSVYETKLVSPAKVEKLSWEKTKAGEKIQAQLSERQLKTLETEYVTKLGGKLTIVPESDPRPAVILDASPMFQPTTELLPSWLT